LKDHTFFWEASYYFSNAFCNKGLSRFCLHPILSSFAHDFNSLNKNHPVVINSKFIYNGF
jgi:hypothetical protein